jgi:rSAM/selenodomain-associated transferase 2
MVAESRGRARQMNAGAKQARGDTFVFVHADTLVPASFAADIGEALSDSAVVGGRFDVELDSGALPYRIIGAMISWRSRLSRTGTGDQAIFVRREMFERLGGFPEIDLCEDLEFSRRLKRAGRVACLRSRVITSARRWNRDGLVRTVLRMWMIRAMYFAGVSPARLKRMYADTR